MLIAARVFAGVLVVAVVGYGIGALWFCGPSRRGPRVALIGLWVVCGAAALIGLIVRGWIGPLLFTIAGLLFSAWWAGIRPAAERDWAADVARTLGVERAGTKLRLHNVRNFDWRSHEDYVARWETRDYDLDRLIAVDLVVSYWMGPAIAHTLVTFAFADGRHLAWSVEVRRLADGHFSAIGGLFRQCELVLVAADERDILRTRTTARGEATYLYRVSLPEADIRALFEAYLKTADKLDKQPRFYNTLTSNCVTLVYDMVKTVVPGLHWNWRLLACGYLPEYLYDLGALDTRLSMTELHERGYINQRAVASDIDGHASADFSNAIRRDLPAPPDCAQPPP